MDKWLHPATSVIVFMGFISYSIFIWLFFLNVFSEAFGIFVFGQGISVKLCFSLTGIVNNV